ncbi:MAG: hypothetical protein V7K18_16465 [Nostoc sp.]|uniref:hypothetical protein n=1 Tax=Nostoc sp. TaxID=1180 RepID=UPI002FF8D9E9
MTSIAAVRDTIYFVRNHTRPWVDSNLEKGYEDPLTLYNLGNVQIQVHAAEALLRRAGEFIDIANESGLEELKVVEALIAVAEAKALATEASLLATNKLFELAGTKFHIGTIQLQSSLAKCLRSHTPRSRALEVLRCWQLLPQWCLPPTPSLAVIAAFFIRVTQFWILDFRLSCGTLRVACFHVRGASRREVVRCERSVERFWICLGFLCPLSSGRVF